MAEHDPRAWRVATALAHATGLDWAKWAMGETAPDDDMYGEQCPIVQLADGSCTTVRVGWCVPPGARRCRRNVDHSGACELTGPRPTRKVAPVPVPAPWDTEAYLADCRRRGVEPGPLPSLRHNGDEVFWAVGSRTADPSFVAYIEVGSVYVEVLADGKVRTGAAYRTSRAATVVLDDLVRATNLARVAAEAMR